MERLRSTTGKTPETAYNVEIEITMNLNDKQWRWRAKSERYEEERVMASTNYEASESSVFDRLNRSNDVQGCQADIETFRFAIASGRSDQERWK